MATDFTLKANDDEPSIQASLTSGGAPVDLTGATVAFIMAPAKGGAPKVNAPAVVVDGPGGVVRYDWSLAGGDTDTPGSFHAEWQITFSDDHKQTAPTLTYHTIDILADLDGGAA